MHSKQHPRMNVECSHCNCTPICCQKWHKWKDNKSQKKLFMQKNTLSAWQPSKTHIMGLKNANLEFFSFNLYWLCMANCTIIHIGMIFMYQGHTHRDLGWALPKADEKWGWDEKIFFTMIAKWIFSFSCKKGVKLVNKTLVNNFFGSSCCCTSYILGAQEFSLLAKPKIKISKNTI